MLLLYRKAILFCFILGPSSCSFIAKADSISKNLINQEVEVALQIYLYDDMAIPRRTMELYEDFFEALRPEIRFKRISIQAPLFATGKRKREISNELREKMESILDKNEVLSYLIIDTHGGKKQSSSDSSITNLKYIGKILEDGVDSNFKGVFDPVKSRASTDLKIVLNSCSSFCGGSASAARRGMQFLNYFSADNGGIFGADRASSSEAFNSSDFIRWKYYLPTLKSLMTLSVLTSLLFVDAELYGFTSFKALFPFIEFKGDYFEVLSLNFGTGLIETSIKGALVGAFVDFIMPVQLLLSSMIGNTNKGYYFALEKGDLKVGVKFTKFKHIQKLIAGKFDYKKCRSILGHNKNIPKKNLF